MISITVTAAVSPQARPLAPVPRAGGRQARALYDFNAQDGNELPFRYGDTITITKMEGEWWEGELNGRKVTTFTLLLILIEIQRDCYLRIMYNFCSASISTTLC